MNTPDKNAPNTTEQKTMATYPEFCTRYKLDPDSKIAKLDYQEYKKQLDLFERLLEKDK